MNRGSSSGPEKANASVLCFNEAPIHESGKFYNPIFVNENWLGLQ